MTRPSRYRWQPTTREIADRFGLLERDVVRFDHNTSPFATDWAPGIVAPLARRLNEYPGASYAPLREAAAAQAGVPPDHVAVGAGIDELILLVARAFLGVNRHASAAEPTYPMYRIATLQVGAEYLTSQYRNVGQFPADAVIATSEASDVVWLCSPGNPTGERIDAATVASVIAMTRGVVVIDAAYGEFAGDRWAEWIERHDNLIVMHTMSKAFGLAGLRVGYAIGQPALIAEVDGVRPPGSISSMSAEIAEIALGDPKRMRRNVDRIVAERTTLAGRLEDLGLTTFPSETNFVLAHVGETAHGLTGRLMREGLVIRSFPSGHALEDFIRLTARSRSENARLVAAMEVHLPAVATDPTS